MCEYCSLKVRLLALCVSSVLRSCPGPALVSTTSVASLAVTRGTYYAFNMECSVTVYSPDGGAVALTFASFDVVNDASGSDCMYCSVAAAHYAVA